jgi:hypothetical protein
MFAFRLPFYDLFFNYKSEVVGIKKKMQCRQCGDWFIPVGHRCRVMWRDESFVSFCPGDGFIWKKLIVRMHFVRSDKNGK